MRLLRPCASRVQRRGASRSRARARWRLSPRFPYFLREASRRTVQWRLAARRRCACAVCLCLRPQTLRDVFWRSAGGGCGWRGGTASRGGGRARARRLLAQRARGGRGHGGPQIPPPPLPASRGTSTGSPFRARLAARSHLPLQLLVQLRVQERAPLVSGARLAGRALAPLLAWLLTSQHSLTEALRELALFQAQCESYGLVPVRLLLRLCAEPCNLTRPRRTDLRPRSPAAPGACSPPGPRHAARRESGALQARQRGAPGTQLLQLVRSLLSAAISALSSARGAAVPRRTPFSHPWRVCSACRRCLTADSPRRRGGRRR